MNNNVRSSGNAQHHMQDVHDEEINAQQLAVIAAKAADRVKAERIVAFDVSKLPTITQVMLIAEGNNVRHVLAIAEEIEKNIALSCNHRLPQSREGLTQANWILLDYGDIVIHIMESAARQFYALERLWSDQPKINLQINESLEK